MASSACAASSSIGWGSAAVRAPLCSSGEEQGGCHRRTPTRTAAPLQSSGQGDLSERAAKLRRAQTATGGETGPVRPAVHMQATSGQPGLFAPQLQEASAAQDLPSGPATPCTESHLGSPAGAGSLQRLRSPALGRTPRRASGLTHQLARARSVSVECSICCGSSDSRRRWKRRPRTMLWRGITTGISTLLGEAAGQPPMRSGGASPCLAKSCGTQASAPSQARLQCSKEAL